MKIGKLTISDLRSLILKNIKNNRAEVLMNPEIGGDCAAIEVSGEKIIYLSSDPITGATKSVGKLALHINANDIATAGVSPTGIMLTILAPEGTSKFEIENIIKETQTECDKLNMSILGGHTEITSAVNRIIVSCTAIGIGEKSDLKLFSKPKDGDTIIITKGIGIEGTGIIASEKEQELEQKFGAEFVGRAKKYLDMLSVVKDGVIANNLAKGMHDVTEGGLFGATWEIAEYYKLGIRIFEDKLFVADETKKICEHFYISPMKLISSGTMLVITDKKDCDKLISLYEQNNIKSFCIGNFTDSKDKLFIKKDGSTEKISEPESDELYKVF
ncbi:MAG: AIR synthase-related protein [Fusobacteriaceae bacterium]